MVSPRFAKMKRPRGPAFYNAHAAGIRYYFQVNKIKVVKRNADTRNSLQHYAGDTECEQANKAKPYAALTVPPQKQ